MDIPDELMNDVLEVANKDLKQITVTIKQVFGVDKIYPMDEESRFFARLAGTTTLTESAINTIKEYGYTVKVKQEEKKL